MNLSNYLLLTILTVFVVNVLTIYLTLKKINKSNNSKCLSSDNNVKLLKKEIAVRTQMINNEIQKVNDKIESISDTLIIPKAAKRVKN